jgi:hypothetical protein
MKQKYKKLQWLLLFWLAVFIGLLIAAGNVPMLTEIKGSRDLSYTHPYDNYTLDITGTWQIYEEEPQTLMIVDIYGDAAVYFTLEVGGIDDMPLADCAKMTIKAVAEEQDISFDVDSPTVADGAYQGIHFTGTVTKNNQAYTEEFFIYHPNEGIRFYAAYIHPESTEESEIAAAKSMISSVVFLDFNQIYNDYLH